MAATPDRDQRKREAAERALQLVKPGMKLGLGSGSTAHQFVDLLGGRVKAGLDIRSRTQPGAQSHVKLFLPQDVASDVALVEEQDAHSRA